MPTFINRNNSICPFSNWLEILGFYPFTKGNEKFRICFVFFYKIGLFKKKEIFSPTTESYSLRLFMTKE